MHTELQDLLNHIMTPLIFNLIVVCITNDCSGGSLGNLLSNCGSFLGVLSKAFCALQSHLKFLQLFSGGGGSLYLLFGATG